MSRYKFYGGQAISHFIVFCLTLLERSAYDPGRVLSSCRCFSKNHDELINFTGVVSKSVVLSSRICQKGTMLFLIVPGRIFLSGIFDHNFSGGTICRLTEDFISGVSKSAFLKGQGLRIGRRRNLSWYTDALN